MTQTRRPQQPDQPRPTARTNSMTATLSVLFAMTTAGNVSAMAVADASMESTYSSLAQRAVDIYNSGKGTGLDGRHTGITWDTHGGRAGPPILINARSA